MPTYQDPNTIQRQAAPTGDLYAQPDKTPKQVDKPQVSKVTIMIMCVLVGTRELNIITLCALMPSSKISDYLIMVVRAANLVNHVSSCNNFCPYKVKSPSLIVQTLPFVPHQFVRYAV